MSQIVRLQVTRPYSRNARLMDRLNALAGLVPESDRGQGALARVLQRIDETILPRMLTVTADTGAWLRLLVSNRRLMRVETAEAPGPVADAPADPDAAAAQFSEILLSALRGAGSVSITSARYSSDAIFWDVGCGPERLAALTGVPLHLPNPGPATDDPETLLGQHALARAELDRGGQVLSHKATEKSAPVLDRMIAWVARQGDATPDVAGKSEACFCIPLTAKYDGLVLRRADGHSVAIIPSALRDRLMRGWHCALAAAAASGGRPH